MTDEDVSLETGDDALAILQKVSGAIESGYITWGDVRLELDKTVRSQVETLRNAIRVTITLVGQPFDVRSGQRTLLVEQELSHPGG